MRISDWSSDVCSSDLLSNSYSEGGGTNWALTWTSYLTDNLSMKLMHGRTERTSVSGSPNDVDCNYVSAGGGVVDAGVPLGCTNTIGRAHVCTTVTNAHIVCRLLLEPKNNIRIN